MNKSEKIAYQQLIDEGCPEELIEKPRRNKWLPQDFFYCWDFIAFDLKSKIIRFVQVSSKYFSQRKKEDQERMKAFPKFKNTTREYWRWIQKEKRFIKENL